MKIVFLNPSLTHRELYGEWDLSDVKSYSTPLGILSLASVARQKGHSVHLVDAQALNLDTEQTIKTVLSLGPDLIGITAMTIYMHRAGEIAAMFKKVSPHTKVIFGGPHITALPEETMRLFPSIDIGVLGEGEKAFEEFLDTASSDNDYSRIKGTITRINNNIINNGRRDFIKDLDILPMPAWDLVPDIKSHYRLSVFGTTSRRSMGLVTSRGCPGQCIFCDTGVFGHRFRCYSARYVVETIERLSLDYSVRDFLFYDDLFVGNKARLLEICELLARKDLKITWSCCARVDYVKPDILKIMKKAGCWMIEYGVESGSQKVLDFMKKGVNIEQIMQAMRWTREARIMAKGNFIFGNILETKESLKESIDLAIKAGMDYFQHTFLTPLPGSKAYEIAGDYGDFDKDWRNMNTFKINYIPDGLTRADLMRYSKLAWRRFYLRPRIIWREVTKLSGPGAALKLILAIKAFIKSMLFRE